MKPTPIFATLIFFLAPPLALSNGGSSSSGYNSQGALPSTELDSLRNFQLGNYSYQIVRVSKYDSYDSCNGHQARHALLVMSNVQAHCTNVSELSYPAQKVPTQLLREGNYFDCGREQLWVDAVDGEDEAQNCVLGYINANNRAWINSSGGLRPNVVFAALGGLVGMVMAML